MKHKRKIVIIIAVLTMGLITACSGKDDENSFLINSYVDEYDIGITFPKDWEMVEQSNFDLQCTNESSYANVFVYNEIDLAEGQTTIELFELQNKNLLNKRENVKKISDMDDKEYKNKSINSILYSAEKDGIKNYYYCNLIDFEGDAGVFAWMLYTGTPSYAEENIHIWDEITSSVKLVEN